MFKDIEYSDAKTCNGKYCFSQNNKNPYENATHVIMVIIIQLQGCIVYDKIIKILIRNSM